MSDDLVALIRQRVDVFQPGGDTERLLIQAANTIELLRWQKHQLEKYLERLMGWSAWVKEHDGEDEIPWRGSE
jgi:hypothetical protein